MRKSAIQAQQINLSGIAFAWELVRQRDGFHSLATRVNLHHTCMVSLLLKQMCTRECKDDRDRVYAIIPDMTKSPHNVDPDYTRTVAQVYPEFARRYALDQYLFHAGLARRLDALLGKNVSDAICLCRSRI